MSPSKKKRKSEESPHDSGSSEGNLQDDNRAKHSNESELLNFPEVDLDHLAVDFPDVNFDNLPTDFPEIKFDDLPSDLSNIKWDSEGNPDSLPFQNLSFDKLDKSVGKSEKSVAEWMQAEIERGSHLYQRYVVSQLSSSFGDRFIYLNRNGNPAIKKEVLDEFESLNADSVVWHPKERYWRQRLESDPPGRRLREW